MRLAVRSTDDKPYVCSYQKLTAIQPLTTAQERQLEQLYIRYAADVDQIDAIVGVAKAAQHRKIKGQRVRTAQQDQVVVRWKPTLMQGWVAEIAQSILKYRIAHARAATTEEIMDDAQNSVVECCSKLPECKRPSLHDTTAIVCDTCHRAYHIECLPPEAKSHLKMPLKTTNIGTAMNVHITIGQKTPCQRKSNTY